MKREEKAACASSLTTRDRKSNVEAQRVDAVAGPQESATAVGLMATRACCA